MSFSLLSLSLQCLSSSNLMINTHLLLLWPSESGWLRVIKQIKFRHGINVFPGSIYFAWSAVGKVRTSLGFKLRGHLVWDSVQLFHRLKFFLELVDESLDAFWWSELVDGLGRVRTLINLEEGVLNTDVTHHNLLLLRSQRNSTLLFALVDHIVRFPDHLILLFWWVIQSDLILLKKKREKDWGLDQMIIWNFVSLENRIIRQNLIKLANGKCLLSKIQRFSK